MLRPAGVANRPSGRTAVLAAPMVGAMLPAGAPIGVERAGASARALPPSSATAPRPVLPTAKTLTASPAIASRRQQRLFHNGADDSGTRCLSPAPHPSPPPDLSATPGMSGSIASQRLWAH